MTAREPTAIDLLCGWYKSNCNDSWEHQFGVTIESLDNPGWTLRVDIEDTKFSTREFGALKISRSGDDRLDCRIESGQFVAFGGVGNLTEIIEVFLRRAEG
jgi:Immunity protein 53